MTGLETDPITVGHRQLGRGLAELGVATTLYDGQDGWPELMKALTLAHIGDGRQLLALSDAYTGRRRDGSYSNEIEAHAAISCIEVAHRPDREDARAKVRGISRSPDRFEVVDVMLSLPCAFWPAAPVAHPPRHLDAAGAAPILVVGTDGDPVTPIEGAEAMTAALDSGHLLRWQGDAHTAFGRGVDCIDSAVDPLPGGSDAAAGGDQLPGLAGHAGGGPPAVQRWRAASPAANSRGARRVATEPHQLRDTTRVAHHEPQRGPTVGRPVGVGQAEHRVVGMIRHEVADDTHRRPRDRSIASRRARRRRSPCRPRRRRRTRVARRGPSRVRSRPSRR